ncbi:MAG: protein translocase subunit SecD [Anaerolineales bacterium]|nr:protein translocase subunit SecD [Anaerolineales bacterium]
MNRYLRSFIFIALLLAFAIWVDLPSTERLFIPLPGGNDLINRDIDTVLGLDLVGGVQALLQADVPPDAADIETNMEAARRVVENRVNGLGVSEAVVQQAGEDRILVELPGETDPETALQTIRETGLLEWVDTGSYSPVTGTELPTDYGLPEGAETEGTVYHTIMTGANIENVGVSTDEAGRIVVGFALDGDGEDIFYEHTRTHVGQFLTLVLDGVVISSPQINSAIPGGSGSISSPNFTYETANELVVQLRSGSLPFALEIVESRTVGPSLGQDSLQKSLIAGVIGMVIVMLFMILYYRLPGVIAAIALIAYTAISYALFRLIPVTLTLPGIAGFVLSIGVAVDANVLIFERLKEELRRDKPLRTAIDLGWNRAWPSIRDSNIATLITCGILFWFGSQFGATIVKGFSITLALGVLVSLFTAIIVTRTILHLVLDNIKFAEHPRWFGI